MFDISWGEFVVLIIAGLFILGPERLPGAAAWLGKTVRQVRDYASGARDQLTSELGPEFDELRKPLEDLRKLRNFDPKRAVTQHLMDATGGYDPRQDLDLGLNGTKPVLNTNPVSSLGGFNGGTNGSTTVKANGYPGPANPIQQRPLEPGEQAPFDPDAT
ncbi:MAG TPA: Sec-independent protein translocase protein TatB [Pseudonocardiaceae bacterium]|nr:Sec-independent protein translocase protein TatB [Pseudonocardiaceae bacterium]